MHAESSSGFRALVVDDDALSRQIASGVLRQLGAREVVETKDGTSALAWADRNEEDVNLIVCDLRMPQVDGLETLSGLAVRTRPTVVVLASGADPRLLRAAADMAVGNGIDRLHVISKPVTTEKLRDVVALLGRPSAAGHYRGRAQTTPPLDCSTKLLRGITSGQFLPFLQPRWDRAGQRPVAAEAQLRWRLPLEGLFAPEAFLDVAQSTGLLGELFTSVLIQVAVHCSQWLRDGHVSGITIDLPVALLASSSLSRRFEDVVTAYGVLPEQITFGMTEAAWLHGQNREREALTRLRLRGFGLAVSQFGTGYASVKQLLRAPITEIKLDPGLIRAAPDDEAAAATVRSCVSLAREFDLTVVGDGVETPRQLANAMDAGCDRVQGALLAPLMPVDEFDAWVARPAPHAELAVPG